MRKLRSMRSITVVVFVWRVSHKAWLVNQWIP
jgi:hypothetical protein